MNFESQRSQQSFVVDQSAESQRPMGIASHEAKSGLIVPVVLSGGGGSRLWPFSTIDTPKQFLPLLGGGQSLFELALGRVSDRSRFGTPVVVASVRHADICAGALKHEGEGARLILEPCARNTAPAIVMAAAEVREVHGDDALMLVMPSDHVIENVIEFHAAIAKGEPAARAGYLVTFGVRPTGPDTGYGYLHMGDDVAACPGVRKVAQFVEKPRLDVAECMVAGGEHLWNAGIFLFQARTILDQAREHAPAIAKAAVDALSGAGRDGVRTLPDASLFEHCPSESIDYAVMERSPRVAVVPMAPGWSDLGSWDALATLQGTEDQVGPVTTVDCESCYIRSDGVQVAALGVRDLIIVASGGRLLILPRGRSQEVKALLSAMDSMAA